MNNIKLRINKVYYQIFVQEVFWFIACRYIVVYGGRRGAKSYDVSQILQIIVLLYSDVGVYCIRKIGTTLKESVFKRHHDGFSAMGLLGSVVIENKSTLTFYIKHNKSFIRCVGLDDKEKLKSVEGVTIVHWEEATECTEEDFDTVDAGLSPTKYQATHILTHNPVPVIPGEMHWIQKKFLYIAHKMGEIAKKDDFAVLKVNYKYNAKCPKAVIKVLEGYKKTNPTLYKMWVLGEFTDFEGVIFPIYKIVSEVPSYLDFLGYGLDFGFSQDPVALVEVWANSEYICIRGILYEKRLTNPKLVERMKELGVDTNADIVADSAEPKSIDEIGETYPYIIGAKKYPYWKSDVIRVVYGRTLLIVEGDVNLLKERATFCWQKERKTDKFIKKPADGNDHYMDAFLMVCLEKLNIPVGGELEAIYG